MSKAGRKAVKDLHLEELLEKRKQRAKWSKKSSNCGTPNQVFCLLYQLFIGI